MPGTDLTSYLPGILVIIGGVVTYAGNVLKLKDLERRVTTLEQDRHDTVVIKSATDAIMQHLRAEGRL